MWIDPASRKELDDLLPDLDAVDQAHQIRVCERRVGCLDHRQQRIHASLGGDFRRNVAPANLRFEIETPLWRLRRRTSSAWKEARHELLRQRT